MSTKSSYAGKTRDSVVLKGKAAPTILVIVSASQLQQRQDWQHQKTPNQFRCQRDNAAAALIRFVRHTCFSNGLCFPPLIQVVLFLNFVSLVLVIL